MKRGPKPGSTSTTLPALQRAEQAWGLPLSDEIEALALACERMTAGAVATRLGYSSAVISQVIGNKYPGDMAQVFAKIRGVYLGEMRSCPVLGEIPTDRCLTEQKRPFAATNAMRARLYHTCATCQFRRPNPSEKKGGDHA